MRIIQSSLFIVAVSFFAMSCNQQTKTNDQKMHSEMEVNPSEPASISLNDGEKWSVNEEMKPFILEAEVILNQYTESNSSDYTTLAAQLKEKNAGLIKSCTMKGESHDELHKWLHPHMALIESLRNSDSEEEANTIIKSLQRSFETYHQYFK